MVRQIRWGRRSQKKENVVTSDYSKLFIEHIFVLSPPAVSSLRAAFTPPN